MPIYSTARLAPEGRPGMQNVGIIAQSNPSAVTCVGGRPPMLPPPEHNTEINPSSHHGGSSVHDVFSNNSRGDNVSAASSGNEGAHLATSTAAPAAQPRYKKTSGITHIILIFDGQNISINQFIRNCKDVERFIDPLDRGFFIRLVKAEVTESAKSFLQYKEFGSLDELLSELKRTYAPTQNLPQIQADLARVVQGPTEKVSEYGLRVTQIFQKAIELINENCEPGSAKGMIEGRMFHDRITI